MKKKILIPSVAVIILIALITCINVFAKDGYSDLSGPADTENIISAQLESVESSKSLSDASKAVDSDINTVWRSSKKNDYIIINFKEEQSFNTAIIREKGWNIKKFNLSYFVDEPGNEHWENFYQQDAVNDYRYCAFDTITAKQIKFEVTEADALFKIREIEFYNTDKKEINNFRVSDYVVTSQLANGELFDSQSSNYLSPEYCNVVNQIHIISSAKWNNEGKLVISDGLSPTELKENIKKIRDFYGDNEVEIFATVFFNACDPTEVLKNKNDIVVENTVNFLLEYGFDGVSYDWEYPVGEQWSLFSNHIVTLKNELSKYQLKISCAVCPWNFYMEKDAINALDQIEIMSYDLFDENGNHSSFISGAVQPVEFFLDKGFTPQQINLGLPFYARPYDGGGIWINYDDANYTPSDRFQNYSNGMWFSGTQMTYDKTAYAIEKNLGGMMIFTATEDISYSEENSLLKSIKTAIENRSTLSLNQEENGYEK